MFFNPARKIIIEEPNCQVDKAISVQSAVLGLPIQEVLVWKPRMERKEFTSPLSPKICCHMMDTATLPPIREGR
ncbi:hypothetical protein D3C81_2170810 [compost metagenome]